MHFSMTVCSPFFIKGYVKGNGFSESVPFFVHNPLFCPRSSEFYICPKTQAKECINKFHNSQRSTCVIFHLSESTVPCSISAVNCHSVRKPVTTPTTNFDLFHFQGSVNIGLPSTVPRDNGNQSKLSQKVVCTLCVQRKSRER
jgi:hypothetical protein